MKQGEVVTSESEGLLIRCSLRREMRSDVIGKYRADIR